MWNRDTALRNISLSRSHNRTDINLKRSGTIPYISYTNYGVKDYDLFLWLQIISLRSQVASVIILDR